MGKEGVCGRSLRPLFLSSTGSDASIQWGPPDGFCGRINQAGLVSGTCPVYSTLDGRGWWSYWGPVWDLVRGNYTVDLFSFAAAQVLLTGMQGGGWVSGSDSWAFVLN